MRKLVFVLFVLIFLISFAYAQNNKPIDSNTLINNSSFYDGKMVVFEGEIIGEIMRRGNYSWININDGANAIGIYIPTSETAKIKFAGKHNVKGDIIRVEGILNARCQEHGGDLDIHADKIEIVKKGYVLEEKIIPFKAVMSSIFFSIGLLLVAVVYKYKL